MPKIVPITKNELHDYYVVEQLTDQEIADRLGCHKQTICRYRRSWEIERIKKWERHSCEPSDSQHQLIIGTILGDAHVERPRHSGESHSCLTIKHALSQKTYVWWKYEQVRNLTVRTPIERNGRCIFRTFAHPYFSQLRNMFYSDRKHVSEQIFEQITPLSIAVWFMDDGTNLNDGTVLRIASCNFDKQEHNAFIEFFDSRFGIKTRMAVYSGYRMLVIDKESRRCFIDLISQYIPDCMKHKVEVGYVKTGQKRF